MDQPAVPPRRRARRAAAWACALATAGAAAAAAPGAAGLAALPGAAGPLVTAVAVVSGTGPVTVPGVHVRLALPALHEVVVSAPAPALARLAAAPGVLGVATSSPSRALATMSFGAAGVYAPQASAQPASGPAPCQPAAASAVGVAVVDTGVSDTAVLNRACGRLLPATDASGLVGSLQRGESAAASPEADGYGHGTYVASLIAGQGVGVDPGARVFDVKVANAVGDTSLAAILTGLNWVSEHAAANHIEVVNLSLSVPPPQQAYGADPLTVAVEALVGQGLTVVAASGNEHGQVSDPGFDPEVLTAGAADTVTTPPAVAGFSGYGMVGGDVKPDLVAPGVSVLGVVPAHSWVARNNSTAVIPVSGGGDLIAGSGTSGATAVVSGAVALLDAAAATPLTPGQVRAVLQGSADKALAGPAGGAGLLQVAAALAAPVPATAPLPPLPAGWDASLADFPAWLVQGFGSPGRDWTTRTWSTRTWSTRTWSTRTWSTRTWSTRTWSMLSWGAAG